MGHKLSATEFIFALLCRHDPGLGGNVVFFGKQSLHSREVPAEKVFATDFAHPWEMVDLLLMKRGPVTGVDTQVLQLT